MPESHQGTVKLYKAPPAVSRYHRRDHKPSDSPPATGAANDKAAETASRSGNEPH